MCRTFKETNLDPGGFSSLIRISERHVRETTLRLPPTLSFPEAVFVEPLACCLRALKRLRLAVGDTVLIVGLGSIGLLMAQLFRLQGVKVLGWEPLTLRAQMAELFGVERVRDSSQMRGSTVDAFFVTAGPPHQVAESLGWLRDGGTVHLFGELGPEPATIDFGKIYHREMTINATYSSTPSDLRESLALLTEKKIDVSSLISGLFPLSRVDEAVSQMMRRDAVKNLIHFN